jgi:hypothetical protein
MECIVSYIDLIGIKDRLESDSRADSQEAISIMQRMYHTVYSFANNSMKEHRHVYYWNDSALMVAEPEDLQAYRGIMQEVNLLKRQIDSIQKCFVVSMKGRAFPEPLAHGGYAFTGSDFSQPKAVFIRASSLAFANCFAVEAFGGKLDLEPRPTWYIDKRIVDNLHDSPQPSRTEMLELFPRKTPREICMYDRYLYAD